MVNKLKKLYNNLDVDYGRISLYYKNLKEKNDWYYKQLIQIYEDNEDLTIETETEEFHGQHEFLLYTTESLDKIEEFITNLNKLIDNDNSKNHFVYNHNYLVN